MALDCAYLSGSELALDSILGLQKTAGKFKSQRRPDVFNWQTYQKLGERNSQVESGGSDKLRGRGEVMAESYTGT